MSHTWTGVVGTSTLRIALSVVILILVAIYFGRTYNKAGAQVTCDSGSLAANVSVNVTCDDGRVITPTCQPPESPCKVGYYSPLYDACPVEQAVGGSPCTSVCYVPDATTTVCDSTGTCAGDATECGGYCQTDADCNATMPVNLNWFGVNDTEGDVPIFWNYMYTCFFNKCELFTLDLLWHPLQTGILVAGAFPCRDYLDTAFLDAKLDNCLVMERFLLDPNLTLPMYYLNLSATPGDQFSMCSFSYGCSTLNQTAIPDKKREVEGDEEEDNHLSQMTARLLARH